MSPSRSLPAVSLIHGLCLDTSHDRLLTHYLPRQVYYLKPSALAFDSSHQAEWDPCNYPRVGLCSLGRHWTLGSVCLGTPLRDFPRFQCPPPKPGLLRNSQPARGWHPLCLSRGVSHLFVRSSVNQVGKMGLGLSKIQLNREGFEESGPEGQVFLFIVSLSML